SSVRSEAAKVLGNLGNKEAIPALENLLSHTSETIEVVIDEEPLYCSYGYNTTYGTEPNPEYQVISEALKKLRRSASNRPIKLLIFDMDLTLYDSKELPKENTEIGYRFAQGKLDVSIEEIKATKARLNSITGMLREYGLDLNEYYEYLGQNIDPGKYLKADLALRELLIKLSGEYHLAVVTNNGTLFAKKTLAALGIADLFEFVMTQQIAGIGKPNPGIFKITCEHFGVQPEEAVSIGDRQDIDIDAAAKIGMPGILVADPQDLINNLETKVNQLLLSSKSGDKKGLVIADSVSLEQAYEKIWQATTDLVARGQAPQPLQNKDFYNIACVVPVSEFPEEMIKELERIKAELRSDYPELEFVTRAELHLSIFDIPIADPEASALKFTPEWIEQFKQKVASQVKSGELKVTFKGVSLGPDGGIFLQGHVEDNGIFDLRKYLTQQYIGPLTRTPLVHMTLARLVQPVTPARFSGLYETIRQYRELALGEMAVSNFSIFECYDKFGARRGVPVAIELPSVSLGEEIKDDQGATQAIILKKNARGVTSADLPMQVEIRKAMASEIIELSGPAQHVVYVESGKVRALASNTIINKEIVLFGGDVITTFTGYRFIAQENSLLTIVTQTAALTVKNDRKAEVSEIAEVVRDDRGQLMALVLRGANEFEKFTVVTNPEFALGIGTKSPKQGEIGKPHIHNPPERPQAELLITVRGGIRAVLYNSRQEKVSEVILEAGDKIMNLSGHNVEFIGADNKLIEIAQGPYLGPDKAKIFFDDPSDQPWSKRDNRTSARTRTDKITPIAEEFNAAFSGVNLNEFALVDSNYTKEAVKALDRIGENESARFLEMLASTGHVRAPPQELLDSNPLLKDIFERVFGVVYLDAQGQLWIFIAPDLLSPNNPETIATFVHESIEAYLRNRGLSPVEAHLSAEIIELAGRTGLNLLADNLTSAVITQEDHLAMIKLLLELNQGALFEKWDVPGVNDDRKIIFLNQLIEVDNGYSGGLKSYVVNAKKLLAASSRGENPFAGYVPAIPQGIEIGDIDADFHNFENIGLNAANKLSIVLVAGGLGERLGYDGIKVAIPLALADGFTYLESDIRNIVALQNKSNRLNSKKLNIPFVIMTSNDTHQKTLELLSALGYQEDRAQADIIKGKFVWASGENIITIVKQGAVPALIDNNASFCLEAEDPYRLETKPHGHGDVHMLLYSNGLVDTWLKEGRTHTAFIQDTNGQVFNAILAVLGISIQHNIALNLVTAPRDPGEKVGAITRLENKEKGLAVVCNVEYNQLDPLLKATVNPA
ncbi:MAG TPA: UTP--glucose-1-phosphate uridylyltransferase, partial [Candidatus Omnitrophota bacterium]|nr:UTP--glucose-1-phosphate uridylyltransferase [Candidatus Omnitrophota bacterium]